MQIRCPQCGHLGADATRAGTALDLRCTACGHTWRTSQTFDEIRYSTDPPLGSRWRNPHTGSVFVRVEGGYHAEQLGTEPVHGKQGSYLYRDGEGRTGPLEPLTTTTTEGTS